VALLDCLKGAVPLVFSNSTKADLLLFIVTVLAAISWGFSKESLALMPPLLFVSSRFFLAGILLALIAHKQLAKLHWDQFRQAIIVGTSFSLGTCFWIMGLFTGESLGVGAFLTSLAIVLVPIIQKVAFGQKQSMNTWAALPVASLGLLLLSVNGDVSTDSSVLYYLGATLFFALFFALNARASTERELKKTGGYSKKVPALALTAITLTTVGLFSALASYLFEPWKPTFFGITPELLWWVGLSFIIGTALRFLMQTYAQSLSSHSHGVVILLLEPIWTALLGVVWYSESMTMVQLCGCTLIFMSLLVTRWSVIKKVIKPSFMLEP